MRSTTFTVALAMGLACAACGEGGGEADAGAGGKSAGGSSTQAGSAPLAAAGAAGARGPGGAGAGGMAAGGTSMAVPGPTADSCDPSFLGPFCDGDSIIGFARGADVKNPTLAEVQAFSVQALNYIRSLTCLPALELDSCLSEVATAALAANDALGVHGYFQANCLNAAHDFGRSCECDWAQENFGAASGSSRTWKDGVIVPLCGMMEEPKGVGHRSNIESEEWTRVGVGVDYDAHGASWYHEFGR